ncbi:MAG: hypothetical protein IJK85_02595 [Bacteroidales bacterium]|nr:hypothetical protein [Bacteroidales bacterium]
MKNYKKVKMLAKNAPTGSYAAGCRVDTSKGRKNMTGRYCEECQMAS